MMKTFEVGEIHPNTPHLFADLVELLLLANHFEKNIVHKSDLESFARQYQISPEELDEENDAEIGFNNMGYSSAEKQCRVENQLEDVLAQLEYRFKAFKEFYPFELAGDTIKLKSNTTHEQRIYKLLLICSRLRSFSKKRKGIAQNFAKKFTKLCKVAFHGLLPDYSSIKIFDANSEDRKNYYGSQLKDAVKILGRDLGVLHIHDEHLIGSKKTNIGDVGFDLVATINFNDNAAVSYAILGQCGAQETNWPKKTLEAHSIRLRDLFQIQFDYPSVMFTPICYRDSDGAWISNSVTNGILLLDRARILKLIDLQQKWNEIISDPWFMEFEHDFVSALSQN